MRLFTPLGLAGSAFAAACAAGLLAGCAGLSPSATPGAATIRSATSAEGAGEAVAASDHVAAPASALVFDLPVAQGMPPINLDRSIRQPAAFVGYEGPTVEYHTTVIDNRQGVGSGWYGGCGFYGAPDDGYQRQDVTVRTSVRYR